MTATATTARSTFQFKSGATRDLPASLADVVKGLTAEGRVVVDNHGHLFGLTLCCNAYDKGAEHGVVCRACYSSADTGEYDPVVTDPLAAVVEVIPAPAPREDYRPAVGDFVTISEDLRRPGNATDAKTWKVEKLPTGRARFIVLSDPAGGRGMKCDGWMLRKATDAEEAAARALVPVERLHVGTVVRVSGPGWKQPADTAYVVLGDAAKGGGMRLVVLGGDGGRYWPSVPRAFLTPVDAAAIIVP